MGVRARPRKPRRPSPPGPRPTLVLLVRHGKTPTTGKVLPGRAPGLHLSDEGRAQAERVAERIAELDHRPVAVYASPLERTRETAAPIARALGLRVRTDRGLLEARRRRTGPGSLDAPAPERPEWPAVQRWPAGFRFPGGESFAEMSTRANDACCGWWRPTGARRSWPCPTPTRSRRSWRRRPGVPLDLFQRLVMSPCSVSALALRHRAAPRALRQLDRLDLQGAGPLMSAELDLETPDRFTVGAIGPVGQPGVPPPVPAQGGERSPSRSRSSRWRCWPATWPGSCGSWAGPGTSPRTSTSTSTTTVDWVVGTIGVSYDEEIGPAGGGDRGVGSLEDDEDDDEVEDSFDGDDDEGIEPGTWAVARIPLTREQAAAFAIRATRLVEAGRPPCPLCGLPLDPSGHDCPRTNGHRPPVDVNESDRRRPPAGRRRVAGRTAR